MKMRRREEEEEEGGRLAMDEDWQIGRAHV